MSGPSTRMLTLLSLLQARRDWPGALLAERLAVSERTVRRDVERLRDLGYRIAAVKGPDGGYRLSAGSELPPLLFDDEQAIAIAVALQNARASGAGIGDAADRALATVRQVMPSRLRHRIDGIRFASADDDGLVDPAVLEAVTSAVREERVLRFDYVPVGTGADAGADADGIAPPRRGEPHAVVARAGRWYLVAWDLDRADWRIFRLDGMRPRSPLGASFTRREPPHGSAAAYLDAAFRGSDEPGRWPCTGVVVVERSARELAPWVEGGVVEPVDERTSLLHVGSWSWAGVLAEVMRFDAPFRVVEPPALAEEATAWAARLAEAGGR